MGTLREIGLSSLIGAVVAAVLTGVLTWRREQRRWVDQNRKLEWRQLIDELHDCLRRMSYAFAQGMRVASANDYTTDPDTGIVRGNQIIANRIFIADAIENHKVKDKWAELVEYVVRASCPRDPSQKGAVPTSTGFQMKATAFEDDLVKIARKDLGL